MLECDVVENNDLKMQMVTTLQSTMSGKRMYADLCERQIALRELVINLLICKYYALVQVFRHLPEAQIFSTPESSLFPYKTYLK
jgi:hypothetical protein